MKVFEELGYGFPPTRNWDIRSLQTGGVFPAQGQYRTVGLFLCTSMSG